MENVSGSTRPALRKAKDRGLDINAKRRENKKKPTYRGRYHADGGTEEVGRRGFR
jgi:hypothetical protein